MTWRRLWPSRREWLAVVAGIVMTVACFSLYMMLQHRQTAVPYSDAGITITWLPKGVLRWRTTIDQMGRKYNVDPNLIAIIMTLESGGYAPAKSEAGAVGLLQVTAPTAQDIAAKYLKQPVKDYDLADPRTSIEFGTAYLAYLRQTFGSYQQGPSWDSTVELIAAGYNGGPGAAANLQDGHGLQDDQTLIYSRDAFNMWRERHAKTSPTYNRWLERGGSRLVDLALSQK